MTPGTQRIQLQPAFVLHRRPYRETSWLLEVFSRDHGRVGLVARGVRQPRKRNGTALEPTREMLLSWALRGELGLLGQVEVASTSPALEGEQLLSALYLNELLLRLITRHDPHPALYEYYRGAIDGLAQGFTASALRRFENHLLREIGYGLNLDHDSRGEPIRADTRYGYRMSHGASPLRQGKPAGFEVEGEALLALRDEKLTEQQARGEIKHLLRAALGSHLGPKPLKTPDLMRNLRRLQAHAPGNVDART